MSERMISKAGARNQRGAAFVEYAVVLAAITILMVQTLHIFSLSMKRHACDNIFAMGFTDSSGLFNMNVEWDPSTAQCLDGVYGVPIF